MSKKAIQPIRSYDSPDLMVYEFSVPYSIASHERVNEEQRNEPSRVNSIPAGGDKDEQLLLSAAGELPKSFSIGVTWAVEMAMKAKEGEYSTKEKGYWGENSRFEEVYFDQNLQIRAFSKEVCKLESRLCTTLIFLCRDTQRTVMLAFRSF